jgi:hypothetical protein
MQLFNDNNAIKLTVNLNLEIINTFNAFLILLFLNSKILLKFK